GGGGGGGGRGGGRVGPVAGAVGGGAGGVGAVGGVAGQVRGEDLAGRRGGQRAAVAGDDCLAVQGEVDGLAYAQVVERRGVDVEEHEPCDHLRMDAQLAAVGQEVRGVAGDLAEAGHEVGLALGDRGGALRGGEAGADQGRVRVGGGLGRGGPFPEEGVADQEQFPPRDVAGDHVRAGGRQRGAGLPTGGGGGQHVGVGERQLGQEVRGWPGEMEGDGAGPVVGDDPLGEVTALGCCLARGCAADGLVVGRAGGA